MMRFALWTEMSAGGGSRRGGLSGSVMAMVSLLLCAQTAISIEVDLNDPSML
jgi:hypothetical protein